MMQPNICLQLHSLKMDQNQGIDCIMHIWRLKSSQSQHFSRPFFFSRNAPGISDPNNSDPKLGWHWDALWRVTVDASGFMLGLGLIR